MEDIRITSEARLLVVLDTAINDWLEEEGYGDNQTVRAEHVAVVLAAIAWLRMRWGT